MEDLAKELRKLAHKLAAIGTPEEADAAAKAEQADPGMRVLRQRMRDQITLSSSQVQDGFEAYLEAAFGTTTDDDGELLEANYSVSDLSPSAKSRLLNEFFNFVKRVDKLVPDHDFSPADLASDFWMTRNGHGTGFWDNQGKPWQDEEVAKMLTDIAHSFGEQDLYISDAGQVEVF